jgi:uncharacterized membrane protein YeaQ/YmgE (transglycosylase-associated protein family)
MRSAFPDRKEPLVFTIMAFIVLGMVAGWVASLVVRGEKRPRDWGLLFIVGVAGSLIGGIVLNLILGNGLKFQPAGIIGSIAVACLLLWSITRAQNRTAARQHATAGGGHRERKGGKRHHSRRR